MTDSTHYCAGCKGREDIIGKLEAEVERLTLTVRKLQGHQGALVAEIAAWLRKEAPAALCDPRMVGNAIEAKWGKQ